VKRHIPGLHAESRNQDELLEGLFLVRVDGANYRWHPQKPFFVIHFAVLEPKEYNSRSISGRLYCTPKALWRFNWFLRDFGYDTDLLGREEVDEKALLGLKGVIRTVRKSFARRSFLSLDAFAPSEEWEATSIDGSARVSGQTEGEPDDLQLHAD
jgi:hypothetical protein